MNEIWKDIPGYEGLYQVSNCGNVRSLDRIIKCKNGKIRGYPGVLLKQDSTKDGHKRCRLCNQGCDKHFFVHRLVASAFIENPNNFPIVNHKDENPSNNSVNNLEWCTGKYNVNYGTSIERRTLHTDYQRIRKNQRKQVAQYDLEGNLIKIWSSRKECTEAGFTGTAITRCAQGKRKKHKGYIWKWYCGNM